MKHAMILFTAALLLTTGMLTAAPSKSEVEFPETFPEELKQAKLRESEVKEIGPGAKYYHYHFDNILNNEDKPALIVSEIFVSANGKDAKGEALSKEDAEAQEKKAAQKIAELREEASKGVFADVAKNKTESKERKRTKGAFPAFIPGKSPLPAALEEAALKLKKVGDISPVIRTEEGFHILRLDAKKDKVPLSIYYLVFDWEKAHVNIAVEQDSKLKTVYDMVKDYKPLAAVNGAYFNWTTPTTGKTYFPLRVDGVNYEAKPGHDRGSAFATKKDGSFPAFVEDGPEIDNYDYAIQGYYIWKDGKWNLDGKPDHLKELMEGGTPLLGVGLDKENKKVVFMICDGRFPKDSPGLGFYGEGYFMSIMGCSDVISLDGGGSCSMHIREKGKLSELKNHPSDNHKFDHKGARAIQNCIYVTDSKSKTKSKSKKK